MASMLPTGSTSSSKKLDDCSICLSTLSPGLPLLTLSCNHKFHLECLAVSLKAQHKQCPLCRAPIDATVTQLLIGVDTNAIPLHQQNLVGQHGTNFRPNRTSLQSINVVPSVEDPVDEIVVQAFSNRIASARQASASPNMTTLPLITASTTLEFDGQLSNQESNIYGLVTLKAPPISWSSEGGLSSISRVPIDLICVVDQSRSMAGKKITLLKQTLVYIAEQLNESDRLAIVSFDKRAYDRSHGLKRMNQQNQEIMKKAIYDDVQVGSGTFIGCGLQMGIDLFISRQTKNPISALLLLTDGQDNRMHDYSTLMQRLPESTLCHTFGYGRDHATDLLIQLAGQGNGGTFTYIDKHDAMGPAFASTMGGLLTCVAQQICVNIEFSGEYQVTHTHSNYKHQPENLPSSKLTFKLNDLNADESRNLLFQLYVPKLHTDAEQFVAMNSLNMISENQSQDKQQIVRDHIIGHVSITYINPNSGDRLTTTPAPFHLVRAASLSPKHFQINHTLDVQRNRMETAFVLKRALAESNYRRSLDLLKAQVIKIQQSVSAQDPFCQRLIKDLEHHYPSERDYRLSQSNACLQHSSERSTYATEHTPSVLLYQSPQQTLQVTRFNEKYT